MPEAIIRPFEEKMVSSALLEIPRNTYQRSLNPERVKRISHSFDERIANEPKVSLRDGHYVVFDGQHVIAARVDKNSGEELPIRCKVYSDLTDKEEASLFANQTGFGVPPSIGMKLRALVFAGDPEAVKHDIMAISQADLRLVGDSLIKEMGNPFDSFRIQAPLICIARNLQKSAADHFLFKWSDNCFRHFVSSFV